MHIAIRLPKIERRDFMGQLETTPIAGSRTIQLATQFLHLYLFKDERGRGDCSTRRPGARMSTGHGIDSRTPSENVLGNHHFVQQIMEERQRKKKHVEAHNVVTGE